MNDRITQLRLALNFTQSEFSEKIGISRSGYACLESKARPVQERHVRLILAAFPQVSEHWLRTGEGAMFEQNRTLIDDLMKKYSFPDIIRKLLEAYEELDESQQQAVLEYTCSIVAKITNDTPSVLPVESEARDDDQSDIDREVEAYRRELAAEKDGQTSSASDTGSTKSA